MYVERVADGAAALRLYTDDLRRLGLACHQAAAQCLGAAPGEDRGLPDNDPALAATYSALAGLFEALGLITYAHACIEPDERARMTLTHLRAGALD